MSNHILINRAGPLGKAQMLDWFAGTLGHQMFDVDALEHCSCFTLCALENGREVAYMPVQQPLMMESIAFRPGLSETKRAAAMTRLAEHAIEECWKRDVAEVYFLCQNPETAKFAERHHFKPVNIPLYRFNLREWASSGDRQVSRSGERMQPCGGI